MQLKNTKKNRKWISKENANTLKEHKKTILDIVKRTIKETPGVKGLWKPPIIRNKRKSYKNNKPILLKINSDAKSVYIKIYIVLLNITSLRSIVQNIYKRLLYEVKNKSGLEAKIVICVEDIHERS